MAEFEQTKENIVELENKKPQQPILDPNMVQSDVDEGIVDLIGRPVKTKEK